jgi:hypothetical protein
MTKKKATAPTVADGSFTEPILPAERSFKASEATQFLGLLGKDPAVTWLRCIKPGRAGASEHQGLELNWINSKTEAGCNLYGVIGNATAATGKGGGVTDADITGVPALFVEWDDGASIEEQMQRWKSLGLPEPSLMVSTGGRSVHCYWVLLEPLEPVEWRRITARLIVHCNSDKVCRNPSRVMRLPGSIYFDKKTGEATGQCSIVAATGARYSVAEIEACLPAPAPAKPVTAAPGRQFEARSIDEINAAAEFIPERVVGEGTYPESRNALCGCSAALAEAGAEDPDEMALALLGHLWPDEGTALQVLETTTTRNAASFWAIAQKYGYELNPGVIKERGHEGRWHKEPLRSDIEQRTYSELLSAMLLATIGDDDDELMQLRAETISRFRLTDAQIEAALFKLHTQQQVQAKAVIQPESLELSRICGMDWLIEGFVPDNEMTLLFGNAGSGKTTAGLAASCSVLLGTGLLDHTQPAPRCNVLFIASDSGAPPLYAAMQEMGMADLPEVQEGPQKRFHVWASDPEQGMTAWAADRRGCIRLLDFITRHQIGLVLIDSCKAVCSGAGLDYTNNQLVTALLTYFKEVICPHAAVVWLNHDGVAKGAHAGAKAWKEIPSIVHSIIREENNDGSFVNNRRTWRVTKSRMGPTREFFYELNNGQLNLCLNQEKVGNCLARVVDVLMGAWQLQGEESLAKADLVERICNHGGPSRKTLENTLSAATRAKHPEICRAGRGRYKLAPRMADALKGCILNGKEEGQIPVLDSDLLTTRQVPMGSSCELANFPVGSNGKSPERSDAKRSDHVPSQSACTPFTDAVITGLDLAEVVPSPAHTPPTPEGLLEQMRREAFDFWGFDNELPPSESIKPAGQAT